MKRIALVTALLSGLFVFLIPPAYAAEGHAFVTASDLQWTDVPALPPGAKDRRPARSRPGRSGRTAAPPRAGATPDELRIGPGVTASTLID